MPVSGIQSAHHLQTSTAPFDIQTNTCQRSMSHNAELVEIGKISTSTFQWKQRGGRGGANVGFLFSPSVPVLNIDFYGRPKGIALLSVKCQRIICCSRCYISTRCLHNKLFDIQRGFLLNISWHGWLNCWCAVVASCCQGLWRDVLRWRNSYGVFVQNLPVPLFLLPLPPSLSLFSLTHIEMKGLLRDDRALLGTFPGPTSARLLFLFPFFFFIFLSTAPNCIALVVSLFQGLSQGLQMCFSEQQWWTHSEIPGVSD